MPDGMLILWVKEIGAMQVNLPKTICSHLPLVETIGANFGSES
jgi:hypothetical protein